MVSWIHPDISYNIRVHYLIILLPLNAIMGIKFLYLTLKFLQKIEITPKNPQNTPKSTPPPFYPPENPQKTPPKTHYSRNTIGIPL